MSKGRRRLLRWLGFGLVATAIAATQGYWRPWLFPPPPFPESAASIEEQEHSHGDVKSLVLSDSAKASLGLEFGKIVLQDYWRNIPIPAEVIEEPGHCEQGVSSTVHGVIQRIHAFHGQTVRSGDPLFDLRPTSDLLITAQTGLLKSIQEIEFISAEIERLKPAAEGLPGSRLIEKRNELKRLESQRDLQSQELLVRGLTAEQISEIIHTKAMVQELTIRVPQGQPSDSDENDSDGESKSRSKNGTTSVGPDRKDGASHTHGSVYTIEQLNVHLGKLVQPGEELCHLARHSELLLAGRAFERENFLVMRAIEKNWPIKAIFEVTDSSPVVRDELAILYSDNVVEENSRTIRFYIPLTNELVRDKPAANGIAYRSWRFKPGQRARLLLPVEHLEKQIVVPSEAVVKEGTDAYVFRTNGKKLEQVSVRLIHLDSRDAVIKSDGTLVAGDVVAMNQAFQLELALKNSQSSRTSGHGHDHHGHDHGGHEH